MRQYTGTVDYYYVFCEVDKEAAGTGIYSSADWDTGGAKTFEYALRTSANGQEPAEHLFVQHPVDAQFSAGVDQGVGNAPFFHRYKESEGYTQESALAELGQQIIEQS